MGGPGVGSGRAGIWPPPVRGPVPAFPPVLGLYPPGVGGGQTRAQSGEGGRAPCGRLGGPGVGLGRTGIWPPPVRGPVPAFYPILGLYPSGVGGRCKTHEVLSGMLVRSQTAKIFYSENLVSMTNSRQADGTLNRYRVALSLLITNEVGFLVTGVSYAHAHYIITSDRHDWIPPRNGRGYGMCPDGEPPKPIMTTDYVLKRSRTNTVPGLLLRALKPAEETTRSPA